MTWTKESVQTLLRGISRKSYIAREHAILRLYARQTEDEQRAGTAHFQNHQGFTGADAAFLSSLAEQILSSSYPEGFKLSPLQTKVAATMLPKYHKQLLEIIQERN